MDAVVRRVLSSIVHARKPGLTLEEIAHPFVVDWDDRLPPILSPRQLAELLGLSVKAVYEWMSRGRLDGAYRRRGKHALIWRDRAWTAISIGFVIHSLRHFFETFAVNAGIPQRVIDTWLGHRSDKSRQLCTTN